MKLLWAFSTFAIGGPQRRAALIMEKLGREHEHVVVALDDHWEAEQFIGPTVRWRKLPLAWRKSSFVSPANLRLIDATLAELKPDLLLTSNWGSIEWAIGNRRTPQIHCEDGFGPDESPSRQNPKRALTRRLVLRGRTVIVPSTTLKAVAIERWGLCASMVHFIPNGIDLDRYGPAARREGPLTIGSIGALRGEKNYARLVRAAAGAARSAGAALHVKLYGAGDRAPIEREAAALGFAHLSLQGATTSPEAALAEFDIFALSSDTEQMPISLMEAMAAGLPVAATNVGDIERMVAEENRAFITPLGDDGALAAAIAALARDPALRRRLGEANRAKARAEFGLDGMVAAHWSLYQRVAARR